MFSESKTYMYERVVKAKLYIDSNYAEKIDIEKVAGAACFSKYHFIRLFENAYGLSPHQYLISVRLKHAKKLLLTQPVKSVCFQIGFDSIPSFSLLFKKNMGITPKEYKEIAKKRREKIKEQPKVFIPQCFLKSKKWRNSNSR